MTASGYDSGKILDFQVIFFQLFARMATEGGKDPVAIEQQEGNIDSASNDRPNGNESPATFDQSSSATTALSSEIATDNSKTQLNVNEGILSDNSGVQICAECNIELDPTVHKFCFLCGKSMKEIVSDWLKRQGNTGMQLCPNCNTELDTNVHRFCFKCGKSVKEMVSGDHIKQDNSNPQPTKTNVHDPQQPLSVSGNKREIEVMNEAVAQADPERNVSVIVQAAEILEERKNVVHEAVLVGMVNESLQKSCSFENSTGVSGKALEKEGHGVHTPNSVQTLSEDVNSSRKNGHKGETNSDENATKQQADGSSGNLSNTSNGAVEILEHLLEDLQTPRKGDVGNDEPAQECELNTENENKNKSSQLKAQHGNGVDNNPGLTQPSGEESEVDRKGSKKVNVEAKVEGKPTEKESKPTVKDSKPTEKESKPTEKDSKPTAKDSKPTEKESKPTAKDSKPTEKESKPTEKDSKPTAKDSKPTEKESKPTAKDSKPTEKDSKPTAKESKPTEKDSKPTEKDSKPTEKDSKPTEKESKPTEKDSKPTEKESKPTGKDSKPTEKESKPTEKDSKPTEKESKPTEKDSKPSAKDSKPTAKESKPSAKESKPSAKESKPSAKESKSTAKESKPSAKESKPTVKESKPTAKESKPTAKESKPTEKERKSTAKESSLEETEAKGEGRNEKKNGVQETGTTDENPGDAVDDEQENSGNGDCSRTKPTDKTTESQQNQSSVQKNDGAPGNKGTITNKAESVSNHPLSNDRKEDDTTPDQRREKQTGDSESDETLLNKARKASSANGQSQGNNPAGQFYKKPEIPKESSKGKGKGKGKGKKNDKKKEDTIPESTVPEITMTVVFHAILSDKFELNGIKDVVIRGQEPVFFGWNKGGIPVVTEKYNDQLLARAEFSVPLSLASRRCGYKYVLLNQKDQYEEIIEYQSIWGDHVNRCLFIKQEYISENNVFHKYDGFVYPKPGRLGRLVSSGSPMHDRRQFFKIFFPKWSGFCVGPFDKNIKPDEALKKLGRLVEGISTLWTSTSGYFRCNDVDKHKLSIEKEFEAILMPKLVENLKVLESQSNVIKDKVEAVVSSVVIAYVFTKYEVTLAPEKYEMLLKCLRLPPDEEVCHEFVRIIDEFDKDMLRFFSKEILTFYQQQSRKKSLVVNWLPALPLLHFLRKESKPFEDVAYEKPANDGKWKWWGLEDFQYRDIRQNIGESEALAMLPSLKDIFDMDRLLKRTFLLLCPVEIYESLLKTTWFSCLELCVTMRRLLPDTTGSSSYTNKFVEDLTSFFVEVNKNLCAMSPKHFPKGRLNETLVLLDNLVYLVYNLTQYLILNEVGVFCRLVECLTNTIVIQTKGIDLQEGSSATETDPNENSVLSCDWTDIPRAMTDQFHKQLMIVESFVKNKLYYLESSPETEWDRELQAWHELLSLSLPPVFYERWQKKFLDKFQNRVYKVSPLRQIELFCQSGKRQCHQDLVTCLSDAAFAAVEKIVKDGQGQDTAFYSLTGYRSSDAIRLLSRMLQKAWPEKLKQDSGLSQDEKDLVLLKHLLTWSTWPGFLKFFGRRSSSQEQLTKEDECAFMMTMAESCLENLINSVNNGTITVATLKLVKENEKQYLNLAETHVKNQNGHQNIDSEASFRQRVCELDVFYKLRDQLQCFISFSNIFSSVDERLSLLREKVSQVDYNELSICDLCTKNPGGYDVLFFQLDEMSHKMVSNIVEIQNSVNFKRLWEKYCGKLKAEIMTMEIIFNKIWSPICEKLLELSKQVLGGEMELKKVDKQLKIFEDCDAMEQEFILLSRYFNAVAKMEGVKKTLKIVISKVKSYIKLFEAREAAKAILLLQTRLGLEGDFSQVERIEEIISHNFKGKTINSLSDNLLQTGKLLEVVTSPRQECLKTFANCLKLVEWLKESIKDEQELKVFVDLAMISAGEDDMEIDRIWCMHTSCLGFGSLIFHYKKQDGFNDLMRLCRPVWQAVDANPGLSKKLIITQRNLSWLKQIKESHGSVALTTMLQVEAINSCGIYFIAESELRFKDKRLKNEDKSCLENLVYLVVPKDEEKNREEKIYSLEEIKDVQSKLMLIAGKAESGKEEVDQFNQVFEGILRVSGLYLQLCEAGEIDSLTWKTKFQCSKIEGRREKLFNDIEECCEKMESDLKKWREAIHDKRHECYSMNHFSMKQILNLRRELAKACTGKIAVDELPLQTFMLLEAVNKDIDSILLANVLKDLIPENSIFMTENGFKDEQKYFADDKEDEIILEEILEDDVHPISPNTPRQKNSFESFISAKDTVESLGYTDEYAIAALQQCGRHATEDELVAWVLSDECDEENVAVLYEEAKVNPHLSDILKDFLEPEHEIVDEEEIILNVSTDNGRQTKKRKDGSKLDKPYVHNKNDTYLTLDVLTAVLEILSEPETRHIKRKVPSMLKEGEPNLLLVPKAEVFGCVLSLFMATAHQPLPTDEEVIVCDENTTAEEVELLWRRAIVDDTGLLFCLVNADLLDYDVSQQALRSLEALTQGYAKYHVVVICSSENEDKSNMVASLDQYRRKFPPVTSMKGIQRYLKEQLVVSEAKTIGDTKWEPAGVVDPEKLSVRVVQSSRAGMGKSLIVKHQAEQLNNLPSNKKLRKDLIPSLCPTVPVHGISVDSDHVTKTLLSHAVKRDIPVSRIFHLDMSQSVVKGLDNFLFKLVILRAVKDHDGNVWRRRPTDMYVIEMTTDKSFEALITEDANLDRSHNQNTRKRVATNKYSFVKFLPRTHCLTPRETLRNIEEQEQGDTGFDMEKFQSEEYQRTFQYLTQFATGANLDKFAFMYDPRISVGDPVDALKIIIKYCGIPDPSWAELHHFVNFLNIQLHDCEESVFCDATLVGDLLQGFRTFAVRFMIQMSRDFATRSLSDSNLGGDESAEDENDDLAPFQIRRRWELSPHPYIFFNHDRHSMTFLGFRLSPNGDLLDPSTNAILEQKLMNPTLRGQLNTQGVNFDVNYEKRNRQERIQNLCSVMGIDFGQYDPDPTYELTTDNVEKILAIHMRFRCGIPVIIMGETGCGKTRLIRFMCELQAGPDGPKNLLLMKVHGGTSYAEIEKRVEQAEKLAFCNEKIQVDTILFFDEANTTDAIDLIKEIMVDRRVNGRAIDPNLTRLHFIAACNPYRKHTKEMIKKLESAGLGYHVSADETEDKLGSIPLRQLVYRVHPLPESMRPLVWDFGQLTERVEELYTMQIVRRFMTPTPALGLVPAVLATSGIQRMLCNDAQAACIARVLSASQTFMRKQKNECSFVSLRDVERAMEVILWFHSNSDLISQVIDGEDSDGDDDSEEESSEEESDRRYAEDEDDSDTMTTLSEIVRAVILGIGVCYYARLNNRTRYCQYICRYFDGSCPLPGGVVRMQDEIVRCQRGFLRDIQLGQNIAKNKALSENVFMMAICTELRIPLFVVGKPGSSKSLAKDVISTNMKAGNSQSELFKNLKQIHMQSYQCSPLSTPEGIVSTFRQCAKLQNGKDLKKFVSVVVLDEIGLAEDSPLMPLKTLHPLLEDGTATTEESGKSSDHQRVGFIGLSNWALDPAKMNRGIMLSRGEPSEIELLDSARGICSSDEGLQRRLNENIHRLCRGYFKLYEHQGTSMTLKKAQKDEFFGLRDFYSLIKMVYSFAEKARKDGGDEEIHVIELEQSIRRNFSGLDDIDPVKIFSGQFPRLKRYAKHPSPECHPVSLIEDSLEKTEDEGESRYLLVLTENYAALRLLQGQYHKHDPVVIFGSSFPKDQQYTQICRNINRIKVCMETGRMVILLNLESLYESLYDALNQYYVYLDKQKYVDLGLGNHRVKCRVADNFKLIVVAEKDVVYERFPIPLINRLEKHLLVMSTGLSDRQARLVKQLEKWVLDFSDAKSEDPSKEISFKPGDCFVGYHSDTAAAVVIQISNLNDDWSDKEIFDCSKHTMLQCASPDAIARLPATKLKYEAENLWIEYFKNQKHGSLKDFLAHCLRKDVDSESDGSLIQITTHSRLLSQANSRSIASAAGFRNQESRCISLQEFHTEQQFIKTLEDFFADLGGTEGLLLVQCDNGERNFNLIACCRYLVDDSRRRTLEVFKASEKPVKPVHIIFVIQLPKIGGGCQHFVGFQGGKWQSVHIDELLESSEQLPQIEQLVNRSVSDLFQPANTARDDNVYELDVEQRGEDIQDVDIDTNLTSERNERLAEEINEENRIRPTLLLKNSLQAAAARIYDESPEVDRATKRIEVLLKWLPEDDLRETELSEILTARIHKLLLERDKTFTNDPSRWLQNEALHQVHLQETGTFRKALWIELSDIVSLMLSEVLALCDRNHNLDLLCDEKEWKLQLWFKMLSEEKTTPLSYDSFISPVSGKPRERARVCSSGAGASFNGKFPFSWIIEDMANKLMCKVGPNPSKALDSFRGVFYSTLLGRILEPVFQDVNNKNEAAMNYLNDFLHMKYKATVDGELELISHAVLGAAAQKHQDLSENEEIELDIPLIHVAYSAIEARLANFSELVQAFPDLVDVVLKLPREQTDVGEMVIDAVALNCCLQQLEPSRLDLEKVHNRLIWCNRVQSIRPIIQVMKSLILQPVQDKDEQLCGTKSAHILHNCRAMWTRLDVVRMFIEHTCPPGQSTHLADAQNALELWKALGENPNFSTVHTMTTIERFLKSCSYRVKDRVINFNINQCEICKKRLQDPVEILPCRHICCLSCANGWFEGHDACPLCRTQVVDNFEVKISERCRRALQTYNSFRNRCKSFFMELVSVYCFGEDLPESDLVGKFIGYVIKDENKTEDFSPFDGQGIDVTPVVRSYILQQLLTIKEREKEVCAHLQEYLRRASRLAVEKEHFIEVCVLCVHCMEDVESVKLLKGKEGGQNVQLMLTSQILKRTLRNLHAAAGLDVESLKNISGIRAALDVLSTYLGDDFGDNFQHLKALSDCLETAKHLCSNSNRFVVQLFLLKQLVRYDPNGFDAVKQRCKRKELKWILPPQAEEQDKTPDTFIVHHDNYRVVREAFGKAILTSNFEDLNSAINDIIAPPSSRSCYILLCLFREITTSFSYSNSDGRIPDRILELFIQFVGGIQHLSNELKELARNLSTNFENTHGRLLQLTPRQSGNDKRLIQVLVHFLVVMKCLPPNRLLQPLTNLAFNPALMMNAFIPTMPHDDTFEVMQTNIGQWYECPNGHHYVITECGRPYQEYTCPDCGSAIGGSNHNLLANNRAAVRQDRTTTGHVLGRAGQSQAATFIRNLNPLSCCVLRCLTHLSMLLATDQNVQGIAAIIKPPVQDVVQFLKEHIHNDIRCIARTIGNNDDEAVQVVHLVLVDIINNVAHRGNPNVDGRLTTKESRQMWEDEFVRTYLNPVLSNVSNLLEDSFGRMLRDERLGNNRLMRLLHELDEPNYDTITRLDPMCPALWRCRKKISIEYLSFKFQEYLQVQDRQDKCDVLAAFLRKEHHLRALQYLPDIIKLQRLLFEKFHRLLDRNEAEKYTLGELLKKASGLKGQFTALVNSFRAAWKIVRSSLSQDGPFSVSKEMCSDEIKASTPISFFLPAKSGLGRCALALNNFLISLHNDFVGRCKTLLNDESSSKEVPLANLTKAHLVAYDPEKDFLPMIFAHCDYSLKVGEGTMVEFNWRSLERQLVDRFIRGRPRLTSTVSLFMFSRDICDGDVFTALKQKIPQVELTRPVQDQILNELNQLADVCDVLKSLRIAIGILSSAGGDPSMSLQEYLHSGLRMTQKNGIKSGKAEHFCQLQHIVSLWLLLSLERARVLTKRKQDPFDDVSENLKLALSSQQKFNLNSGLQKINVDHFVRVLLEYILLHLKHGPQEQLHWPLWQCVNIRLEAEEREPFDGLEEYIPEDITVKHAVEAWKVACQKSEDYHSRMQ